MPSKLKEETKASLFVCRILFSNTPFFVLLYCIIKIAVACVPAVSIFLTQNVLDRLIEMYNGAPVSDVWKYIVLLLAIMMIYSLLDHLEMTILQFLRVKNEKFLSAMIDENLSKIKIYRLEDGKSKNTIHQVLQSEYSVTGAFYTIINHLIVPIITFASTVSVIFYYYPWVALLYVLTVIPSQIISASQNRKMYRFSIDEIPETRKKDYYFALLTDGDYAKEQRLFNLAGFFKKRFNDSWKKILNEREKVFVRGFRALSIATLLSSVGYILMYTFLIYKTYQGELTVGGLTAFAGAIFVISGCFGKVSYGITNYRSIYARMVLAVMEFMGWEEEQINENAIICDGYENGTFEVSFQNVSFSYPNTDHQVLKALSFTIHPEEKVALVGVNGAGKSTIVKLLLRMYEPDEGEILINGVNINEYDIVSYRKMFGVCFQNVNQYSLSFSDNIALSDISEKENRERIDNAVEVVGLENVYSEWKDGVNTPLTRRFSENGKELSGGQWQKVGLARAFFRNAPFVVLDEPSAALDPSAEEKIFRSFSDLCAKRSGILISHRLSAIMLVDRVLFLEDGQITESGTHNELMEINGTYARMYHLQAQKYQVDYNDDNIQEGGAE